MKASGLHFCFLMNVFPKMSNLYTMKSRFFTILWEKRRGPIACKTECTDYEVQLSGSSLVYDPGLWRWRTWSLPTGNASGVRDRT